MRLPCSVNSDFAISFNKIRENCPNHKPCQYSGCAMIFWSANKCDITSISCYRSGRGAREHDGHIPDSTLTQCSNMGVCANAAPVCLRGEAEQKIGSRWRDKLQESSCICRLGRRERAVREGQVRVPAVSATCVLAALTNQNQSNAPGPDASEREELTWTAEIDQMLLAASR